MKFASHFASHIAKFGLRYPIIGKVLFGSHSKYVRSYVWAVTKYQNIKYNAPIDPYQIYWVDPNDIQYALVDNFWWKPYCVIKGGNWDKKIKSVDEQMRTKSLKCHFSQGTPWRQTKYFKYLLEKSNKNGSVRFGSNEKEILHSLEQYDELYSNIKRNGYKTQRQLREEEYAPRGLHRQHLPPELLEIAVAIDRNGNWIHDDGGHRLVMSQILNLDKVPVRVIARHRKWQQVRDKLVQSRAKNKMLNKSSRHHPDLEPLYHFSK